MRFFNPTSSLKELLLLQHIEKDPNTTQKEIAEAIDAATSMVNSYVDKLEEEGHLIREYQTAKKVYYKITNEGRKHKNYLSIVFLRELISLYKLAEEDIKRFLQALRERGCKRFLVYGAGEVAETILRVTREESQQDLKVLALVDDNEDLKGERLQGYEIISRDQIKDYKHDCIVITSYIYEEDIEDRLKEIDYPREKIVRFFTG